MSEDINYVPEAPESFEQVPEKKNNKTLWIVLAVVAVLLLCCCLVLVLGIVLGFLPFAEEIIYDLMYKGLPYLAFA